MSHSHKHAKPYIHSIYHDPEDGWTINYVRNSTFYPKRESDGFTAEELAKVEEHKSNEFHWASRVEWDDVIHDDAVVIRKDGTTIVPDDNQPRGGLHISEWDKVCGLRDRMYERQESKAKEHQARADEKLERDHKRAIAYGTQSNVIQYPSGKPYQQQRHDDREPKDYWLGERPYTAQRWLIDGILPYQGVALISGQWGAGKTFTAMELATCLMSGASFAAYSVPERAGVLWLAAEGAPDVPIRMAAACAKHGIEAAGQPFVWHDIVPVLTGPEAYEMLSKRVRRVADAMTKRGVRLGLVIVDTMATAAGWADENDNAEAQQVMNLLRRVSDAASLLVIAIDHFGKTADGGTRGASSKEAAADTVLAVLGDKQQDGAVKSRRVAVRKNRYGRAGVSHAFALPTALVIRPDSDACDETCIVSWEQATVETAEPVKPFSPSIQAWLEVFDRNVGNDGTLDADAWWQAGQDEGGVSVNPGTYRNAVSDLLAKDAIRKIGPKVYRRAPDDINGLVATVPA